MTKCPANTATTSLILVMLLVVSCVCVRREKGMMIGAFKEISKSRVLLIAPVKKLPRPRAKKTDEEQCARNPAVRTESRSLGDKQKEEEPDTSAAASSLSAVGTESKSRGHSSERQAPFRSASRNQPSGTATEGGDSLGCFPNPESHIQKSSMASSI